MSFRTGHLSCKVSEVCPVRFRTLIGGLFTSCGYLHSHSAPETLDEWGKLFTIAGIGALVHLVNKK
jgi:hypothetical protein